MAFFKKAKKHLTGLALVVSLAAGGASILPNNSYAKVLGYQYYPENQIVVYSVRPDDTTESGIVNYLQNDWTSEIQASLTRSHRTPYGVPVDASQELRNNQQFGQVNTLYYVTHRDANTITPVPNSFRPDGTFNVLFFTTEEKAVEYLQLLRQHENQGVDSKGFQIKNVTLN